MSYLVIARKFRPKRFEDLVGQEVVARTLRNALELGRVAHAYLFSGTRGVGKTTTARLLAKCLNCHTGVVVTPCDACPSCREIGTSSLDVLEIDGASNRGINEVRELRESARYAPARDRHKIFIIDEVHMLTAEAWNALLKTIEEPPPHVIFILATTEKEKVPATILSRCQKFDFRRLSLQEIASSLDGTCQALGIDCEPAARLALARAADGSMRDAQSLLEQVRAYAGEAITAADVDVVLGAVPRELLLRALEHIAEGRSAGVLEVVDKLYETGQDPRLFVSACLQEYRNLILIAASGPGADALTREEAEQLSKAAEGRTLPELLRSAEVLARLDRDLRLASQPRFALEVGLLELCEMKRLLPIEELLARVEGASSGAAAKAPSAPIPKASLRPTADPESRSHETSPTPAISGAARAFLDEARATLGIRAGFLDSVTTVKVDGDAALLAIAPGQDLAASVLVTPDVQAALADAARRHLRVASVRVLSRADSSSEGGAARPAAEDVPPSTRAHPLVRKLLDVFQGEVAAVESPSPERKGER